MGKFSTRLGVPVPDDGEEAPADGDNAARTYSTDEDQNWGDSIQTLIYGHIDQSLGEVGLLSERPQPGGDAPRWFLVTDASASDDEPVLYYNDESASEWKPYRYLPSGDFTIADGAFKQGVNPQTVISETSSPTSFTFSGSTEIDLHRETSVSLSNDSGSSATEDVTASLYDGVDSTGTLLLQNTVSTGSVAAGGSTTVTVLTSDEPLDTGDYYMEVSVTGTAFSVSKTEIQTAGMAWDWEQAADGSTRLVNTITGARIWQVNTSNEQFNLFQEVDLNDNLIRNVQAVKGITGTSRWRSGGDGSSAIALYDNSQSQAFLVADEANQRVNVPFVDLQNRGSPVVTTDNYVARLVDSPNGTPPTALLEDTESTEITVPVADTETLKVYRWGAYLISDGTTPLGLDVQLLDGADTVQASANTGDTESTDKATPVASHQNTSGSVSIFKLAINNGTGTNYTTDGVGGMFAYIVE